MKSFTKQIAWTFSLIILFQCCAMYQGNYSLDEAAKQQIPARVTMIDGGIVKYDMIRQQDSSFHGLNIKKSKTSTKTLKKAEIAKIELQDFQATARNNEDYLKIGGIVLGAAAVVALLVIALNNLSFGFSGN